MDPSKWRFRHNLAEKLCCFSCSFPIFRSFEVVIFDPQYLRMTKHRQRELFQLATRFLRVAQAEPTLGRIQVMIVWWLECVGHVRPRTIAARPCCRKPAKGTTTSQAGIRA